MYQKSLFHYLAKTAVDVLFYIGIICVAALPFFSKPVSAFFLGYEHKYALLFLMVLFLSGCCGVYILFHLKQMYKSLLSGNPFIDENISHFRKMAVACFVAALIYVAKCIFMFTVSTVLIIMVFLIGCLFCLTLKDLFKQAVNYKTENDLTI